MFLLFGSWVLNPSWVHNTGWAILYFTIPPRDNEWAGILQPMVVSVVLTQCAGVQVIKFKMLIVLLKMGPKDFDVSPDSGGVSRLTAEDLGTFWSRRKKSRETQAHRPFSSFWSRRKKSRTKLPSLPFSTIIRYQGTRGCRGSVVSSPRHHQGKRTIYWSKRSQAIWAPITQPSGNDIGTFVITTTARHGKPCAEEIGENVANNLQS